eukprot:5015148-Amphidinium_carterae.1
MPQIVFLLVMSTAKRVGCVITLSVLLSTFSSTGGWPRQHYHTAPCLRISTSASTSSSPRASSLSPATCCSSLSDAF